MEQAIDQYLKVQGYDKLEVKAVFFDMDGVLFDSMKYHAESWIYAMGQYGIPFTTNEAYMCEGRTGASTITEYFERYKGDVPTKEKIDEVYGVKAAKFYEISTVRIIEGVDKLITMLKERDVELFVVTGSGQKTLIDTLGEYFPDTFDRSRVVCAYDVMKGKPDPEPYLIALERAGVKKNEAIVVENAPLGVKSASAAGLFAVAVNTGTLPDEKLTEYGANVVYDNMKDMMSDMERVMFA